MCYMRFVCLFASTLTAAAFLMSAAQSPTLQRGVSVQMAVTNNAAPMPDADNHDAWIVTVTADGKVFFGIDPFTPSDLAEKMKTIPRRRDQKLYIKADDRAPFAVVERVLDAGRTVFFDAPVLLTAQPETSAPGTIVSPKGLEVFDVAPSNADTVIVQINAGQPSPTLQVNDADTSWAGLANALKRLSPTRGDKAVVVKVAGRVPFGQVAHVVDVASSIGAKVVLPAPGV